MPLRQLARAADAAFARLANSRMETGAESGIWPSDRNRTIAPLDGQSRAFTFPRQFRGYHARK